MSDAKCYDCGLSYADEGFCDLVVSDQVWEKISPTGHEGGLLCPTCMVRAAVRSGIDCMKPVSAVFHSGPFCTEIRERSEMKFERGQKVVKIFHGLGGYTERVDVVVHSVENGVVYLRNRDYDEPETGITYDAETGRELENFFLPIWSEIREGAGCTIA